MDSVWVGDSLTAKPRLEAMTTLAAIAARTSRVRLGTAVMLMALRHPVLLAQMMGTVDLISGGRLQLGVGVGGAFNGMQQAEWRNADVPQRTRARRLEEMPAGRQGIWDLRRALLLRRTPLRPGCPRRHGAHSRSTRRCSRVRECVHWLLALPRPAPGCATVRPGGRPASGMTASCPFPTTPDELRGPRMVADLSRLRRRRVRSESATPGRRKPPCI